MSKTADKVGKSVNTPRKKSAKSGKERVKAGNSKAAAAARRAAFAHAFIANGRNGTQAAVTAGYKPGRAADKAAERLLKDVAVCRIISEATEKAAAIAGLTVERTLREVARLAYSDPRKLRREDGSFIPMRELDDDAAATIAGVEVDEIKAGGEVIGHTVKVKTWDKNSALEKAMKHLGLYKIDNEQKKDDLDKILAHIAGTGLVPIKE